YTEFNFGVDDILIGHPGIQLRVLEDELEQNMIHSKYLLVEGGFDGETDQHVIFTGSPNISYNALNHNDEVMLRVIDQDIHSQPRCFIGLVSGGSRRRCRCSAADSGMWA